MEGVALDKAAGKYDKGVKLTAAQVEEARQRVDSGVPKAAVARELGISRQTLYTALSDDAQTRVIGSLRELLGRA